MQNAKPIHQEWTEATAKRVRGWVSIALTDADGHHLLKQIAGAYGASCKLDIAKPPITASSGKAMATVEKRSTLLSCHAVVEWDDWTASSLDGRWNHLVGADQCLEAIGVE